MNSLPAYACTERTRSQLARKGNSPQFQVSLSLPGGLAFSLRISFRPPRQCHPRTLLRSSHSGRTPRGRRMLTLISHRNEVLQVAVCFFPGTQYIKRFGLYHFPQPYTAGF